MRHFLGVLVGIAVTPLLWVGTAWPAEEFAERVARGSLNDPMLLSAAAVVMAVGLLCGLLAGTRISPLAALLPGLVMLTFGLWPLVAQDSLTAFLPSWLGEETLWYPVGPALPMNLAIGTLLIISATSPSRWRRRPATAAAPSEMPALGEPTAPGPGRSAEPDPLPRPANGSADDHAPEKTTTPFRR